MSDPYQLSAGISCSSCLSGADPGGCLSIRSDEKICSLTPRSPYLFLIGIDMASLLMTSKRCVRWFLQACNSNTLCQVWFRRSFLKLQFTYNSLNNNYNSTLFYNPKTDELLLLRSIKSP